MFQLQELFVQLFILQMMLESGFLTSLLVLIISQKNKNKPTKKHPPPISTYSSIYVFNMK